MLRIKLFGLFIAFAVLALVRPKKCLELLEAAERDAKAQNEAARRAGYWKMVANGMASPRPRL